ncbi:glycoside hydrolase family protein [Sphaerotilus natans subsp. natans DSM 6575]|uniref:Glycoside hydrolase family protein n=1 Tax=Sphaerotilus natans subsp. natans DSM 6575 TaxID=1286631 RepID=A0A059KNK1_9BURK|nr:alpha-glucosidase/alpha-galactosidase [Sphaerotilus natans]KDB53006.1 glycoside hydrolase family protein [Sphaerotilus natans subsp. natans DSM 6575]SIQ31539.1 alpha-galactosidase [Sphaerotilus natans]
MSHRRPKITLIGAGSTVFTRNLLGDILAWPELAEAEIALHDIDVHRLDLSRQVAERLAGLLGARPLITATTDRRRALDGARFVINTIQVGGYRPSTVIDFEIPKKYGLRQTIGDTLGIGGIMRALRTIPVQLAMQRDMDALCAPGALHLNYVNPMAMLTWALNRASTRVPTVGLCHSVQGTAHELARDLDLPADEIDYLCAGINHMAFYLRFEHRGQDLYPRLRQIHAEGRAPDWNRVRYEMLAQLGHFATESSEHFAEYTPWFIKKDRPELLERFNVPLDEYPGRCQVYERAWPHIERELQQPGAADPAALRAELEAAKIHVMPREVRGAAGLIEGLRTVNRSMEYGGTIIHSMVSGQPSVIYGNVPNRQLIDNLPQGCCVEVPCLVDANGVQPTRVGALPVQLAALMRTNVNVQELVVESVFSQRRDHVYHAAMLDPHTAAELDLSQIRAMVDELLAAHGDILPEYLRN